MTQNIVIIGGGAAGFFAALRCKALNPKNNVVILEKSSNLLSKVKVSGGGRCNVTHACFEPKELAKFYPRGSKELLGPFHQFMTGDMMEWLSERGVETKIEEDNRVFPSSNSSQTIIDCFTNEAKQLGVVIKTTEGLTDIKPIDNKWQIKTTTNTYVADKVLIATGSSKLIWDQLSQLQHTIVPPVPSLFTFNIQDHRIKDIPGVVVKDAEVKVPHQNLSSTGPVLITHWGLSAPAILKLSAWGARKLAEDNYQFKIDINWVNTLSKKEVQEALKEQRNIAPKQKIATSPQFDIPKRLWSKLCIKSDIDNIQNWADISKKKMEILLQQITNCEFTVNGKSTFKEEFVTSGGIDLSQIDFKRFESKIHPNLFFAGEVLDIDAVTGGFNFQAAWTGGWIAANAMSN
jgi:predicted Rossmann fold flavoprotein